MLRVLAQRIRIGSQLQPRALKFSSLLYSTKKYTKDHEWVEFNDKVATVGITKYATQHLGEIVFAELPETGKSFETGETVAAIESVKAVGEVYSPVMGKVVETNPELVEDFTLINEDPEAKGWLCKMEVSDTNQTKEFMDKTSYDEFLKTQSE